MSEALLATKLYVPRAPAHLVLRPRLVQQLDDGLARSLTLLAAPAGFGKTTLLSHWHADASRRPWPVAWISLDSTDNDPVRFLAYCIAALQTVEARLGEAARAALHSPQPPPPEAVLTALINDLTTLSSPFVIVFDDYDVIEAPAIHEIVTFLLDHAPPQMRLIITSRADPPLPLARLRAHGRLTELRTAELRFTPAEAAAFINRSFGLELAVADIAALDARTEGWIVGLQLAALSMQGRGDLSQFIRAFTGDDRYVLDYLTSEVLQRQPERIQNFLLQTCILDRLNGPLCDTLTGLEDGQATLEALEQANLFILPLDNQRRWYRYHRLFAESLRYHLQRTQPESLPALHGQASRWHEQHGFVDEAVNHALAAQDFQRAARLVERNGIITLGRGQVRTVLAWLNALPEELVSSQTGLCILHAAALTFNDQPELAQARLRDGEQCVSANGQPAEVNALLGQVAVVRAWLARLPGDLAQSVAYARQALDLLPESDIFWRGPAAAYAGLEFRLSGDVSQVSEQQAAEAIRLAQESGNRIAALAAMTNLAKLQIIQGRLRAAAATFQKLWQWASEREELWLLVGSPAYYLGMGDLLREWNELEAAERHLLQGLEMNKWVIDAEVTTAGYLALAALKQAQGDLHGALETVETVLQIARQRRFAQRYVAWAAAIQAQLWVMQGRLDSAARWARQAGVRADDTLTYPRMHEYLALVRLLRAQRKVGPAARLLEQLAAMAEAGGQMWILIEILGLQALTHAMQDDQEAALATLERALAIAEHEGYIRTFANEGAPMHTLLRRAAARGLYPDYLRRLLAAFSAQNGETASPQAGSSTLDQLSARETEVLRLVASGKSSPEIADLLVVGVSTVRTHIKNIYSKLDAHSRDQAVERARMRGLL